MKTYTVNWRELITKTYYDRGVVKVKSSTTRTYYFLVSDIPSVK